VHFLSKSNVILLLVMRVIANLHVVHQQWWHRFWFDDRLHLSSDGFLETLSLKQLVCIDNNYSVDRVQCLMFARAYSGLNVCADTYFVVSWNGRQNCIV
jgi:hypothetical protein